MESSDVKRLKELEEENSRLKKMYRSGAPCGLSDGQSNPQRVIRKKGLGSAAKRQLTEELIEEHHIAVSRACKILSLNRSQFYYTTQRDDTETIEALQELAFKHPTYGFRKLFAYLRKSGKPWNHKRVYRVYKLLQLNRKRKGKRRLPDRIKQPLQQPTAINVSWNGPP